jgi:hypothetical protein
VATIFGSNLNLCSFLRNSYPAACYLLPLRRKIVLSPASPIQTTGVDKTVADPIEQEPRGAGFPLKVKNTKIFRFICTEFFPSGRTQCCVSLIRPGRNFADQYRGPPDYLAAWGPVLLSTSLTETLA